MNSRTVLVVDDDHDLRDTMSLALETEGYTVLRAENGKRALDMLIRLSSDELPNCIVLDMMMPEMDGKTFIEHIRKKHSNDLARIPILIATAKGSPADNGIINFPGTRKIKKPMELEELFEIINEICNCDQRAELME